MKALLLHPLVPFRVLWGKFHKGGGFILPIGLLSIAAYSRKHGFDVQICDTGIMGMDEDRLRTYLRTNNYGVIGIQCFTNTAAYTFKTAKICRETLPDAKIIVGGVHATILPAQTLKESLETDIVVIGEGEITFTEILKWRRDSNTTLREIQGIAYRENGTIVKNPPRPPIHNLDEIPLPGYELLPLELYLPHPTQCRKTPSYPIIASRGCPFACTFCSASIVHGKKLRFKGLDRLFEEINLLRKQYKTKSIFFQDSSFTTNRKYVKDFCQRIIEDKIDIEWMCNARVDQVDLEMLTLMKKGGCWQVNYGIESGNEESLIRLKKRQTLRQIEEAIKATQKAGLKIMAFYILGLPGEDEERVLNTIKFAKKLASETALFYLPVPYPGTELMRECEQTGGIRKDARWEDYSAVDFSNPIYINPLLGKEKMIELYNYAHRSYYTSPKVIINILKSIRSTRDIARYLKGFKAVIGLWTD